MSKSSRNYCIVKCWVISHTLPLGGTNFRTKPQCKSEAAEDWKEKTILARLLWGVKATLLWKGSVNPYYAEINGSPIFADCTRRRVTRAQRFS